jgi:ABC-type phosphate transport system auxiliary subunit
VKGTLPRKNFEAMNMTLPPENRASPKSTRLLENSAAMK